jgi:hypothetical protein
MTKLLDLEKKTNATQHNIKTKSNDLDAKSNEFQKLQNEEEQLTR